MPGEGEGEGEEGDGLKNKNAEWIGKRKANNAKP
jgi:hypothetical protein